MDEDYNYTDDIDYVTEEIVDENASIAFDTTDECK